MAEAEVDDMATQTQRHSDSIGLKTVALVLENKEFNLVGMPVFNPLHSASTDYTTSQPTHYPNDSNPMLVASSSANPAALVPAIDDSWPTCAQDLEGLGDLENVFVPEDDSQVGFFPPT